MLTSSRYNRMVHKNLKEVLTDPMEQVTLRNIQLNENDDVVVRYAPEHYPRQEGLTCGETNLRGILAGFDIHYQPPESLRLRIRLFGYSFIQDISNLLKAHGVSAPVQHANKLSAQQKLETIKGHIDDDQPVLLAIGNGYLQRGVYTSLARYMIGHFITIYGYSEKASLFYIYDPYLEGAFPGGIPVGNDTRTFSEVLRDWRGPIYYKFIGMDHVYIPAGINRNPNETHQKLGYTKPF